MKNIIVTVVLFAFFAGSAFAGAVSFSVDSGAYNQVPPPRLMYPISETATLTGNAPLEFRWLDDYAQTSGFILKIYKGYNMYADNLIYKENIPAGKSAFEVKADIFIAGQVYTWSLVRVSFAGYKSDRSFNSFKLFKKDG